MAIEFDVWGNGDGQIKAGPVTQRFVDDSDAPYGFDRQRISLSIEEY